MNQFEQMIEKQEKIIKEKSKGYHLIGNLRLGAILVSIYAVFMLIDYNKGIGYLIVAILGGVVFLGLVKKHNKIKEELNYARGMIKVNKDYLARLQGAWSHFEVNGEEFLEDRHPYALDLDIVGQYSLFQMINTAGTYYGKESLANWLLEATTNLEEIIDRQQAVKELGGKLERCQRLEYASKKKQILGSPDIQFLNEVVKVCEKEKGMMWLQRLPYFAIGCLGIAYIFKSMSLGILGVCLVILQCLLSLKDFNEQKLVLNHAREIEYFLTNYSEILVCLEQETFYSKKLKKLTACLYTGGNSAKEGIKELEKISARANLTRHPILAIVLNVFWLWDYKRLIEVRKWQKKYGIYLEEWLYAIGEIEALMSLAVLLHLESDMEFPIFEKKNNVLHAREVTHPLISKEKRIANDINMDNQIWVITGSNMSGKTTLLRTVGINLVLAYSGAPVCAKSLVCSRFAIYTSMRIRDDLKEGLSTFYAELMRIKQMIEYAKNEDQMLFLIDEIFRGTNSIDRIEGARSVLGTLNQKKMIGAITTHDLELCALARVDRIKNYHFTESYEKNQILFDYKLKEGPSTSTNARYLMKMVGIEIEN